MAKGVTIYTFFDGVCTSAFGSLSEAEKAAQKMQDGIREDGGDPHPLEIERNVTVPLTKANFVKMFTYDGGPHDWCTSTEVVKTID